MITLHDLQSFLDDAYRRDLLPENPSMLFHPVFLRHMADEINGVDGDSCADCDAVVEGLSKAIAVWVRWLCPHLENIR